jgi:hypothetical protein
LFRIFFKKQGFKVSSNHSTITTTIAFVLRVREKESSINDTLEVQTFVKKICWALVGETLPNEYVHVRRALVVLLL